MNNVNNITVKIPEGQTICDYNVKDGSLVITLKKIAEDNIDELPKTWEEFCHMKKKHKTGCYINTYSNIQTVPVDEFHVLSDKNILPNTETAQAVLALCQLIQLRDYYNNGWKPNWGDCNEDKYVIYFGNGTISTACVCGYSVSPLYFDTYMKRDAFLNNFRCLINELKPLYGIDITKTEEE